MQQRANTFAGRVLNFYENNPGWTSGNMVITSPWTEPAKRTAITEFYQKFFSDDSPRTYILGINPGRYTATSTGVPYTDGYALEHTCRIANSFAKSREMVAKFIERVVAAYGGAEEFYADFYAGAVFPFEILLEGKYRNYYASDVWDELEDAIIDLLEQMAEFGSNGRVVILGSGLNKKFFDKLNAKLGLFEVVGVLDHPRYLMQYKSGLDAHVQKYVDTLKSAL
jgi:hypothetical protein